MAYKENSGIYLISNKTTSKVYVGSSNCIQRRWYEHTSTLNRNVHGNEHLQNAWNKYGKDDFLFEVLENCEVDNLVEREGYWTNYHGAFDKEKGYNLTNTERRSLSEETKRKLSEAHKGKKLSEETKRKLSELNKGISRPHTEESRKKMSEARKGMVFTEEHRRNLSKAHQGKTFDDYSERQKAGYQKAVKEGKFRKKITPTQAEEIRKLKAEGIHYKELMKMFGVSDRTIYDIVNNKYHKKSKEGE